MPDTSVLITKFKKNATEDVHVSLDEFHGKKMINFRVWFQDKETGDMRPGKQGLALAIDKFDVLKGAVDMIGQKLGRGT